MKWQEEYQRRLTTAEEAVRQIHSGDRVILGHCTAEPPALVNAMVAHAEAYRDVTISHMLSVYGGGYAAESMREHFRFEGFFCSGGTRSCVEQGYGDVIPVHYSELPGYLRRGVLQYDVCMVLVSTPDENGYCYLAGEAGYTYQAVKSAKLVLAQVSNSVPRILGDTRLHVSEIDWLVEADCALPAVGEPEVGEVQKKIGAYCASLVEDGSTIQAGYGEVPNAVMAALEGKKHLGVHTEMLSDGIMRLYQKGVIDNSQKAFDQGKMVATLLLGSEELYRFVHQNPAVELRTVDYTNDPYVIAECSNMVAINSALQVDFYGQVVSDCIGKRQFSGVGGQVDFVRGANLTRDGKGKAIIILPSTAKLRDGTVISRIVPFLDEGAAVTVSRCDVDYVVTEHGIAHLRGLPLQKRGRELIRIAHPDFREGLERAFFERYRVMS